MHRGTQYLKSSPPTPHAVVIDRGHAVYMGAINDTPSTRLADVKTAHNYVAAALDAIAAGQRVAVASTRGYGCSIKSHGGVGIRATPSLRQTGQTRRLPPLKKQRRKALSAQR